MQDLTDIIRNQHASRPAHDDPLTDEVLAELLRAAEEVCVLRDRLATCQQLAAEGKAANDAAIDAFEPDAAETERRLARHKAYFESLFERLANAT